MTVDVDENELVEEEHYAMAGQEHRDVISRLYEGLKLLFVERNDRLVMAEVDLYPPGATVKMIPDLAVVAGLPQTVMRSYRVGETGPSPAIVFEIVSRWENEDARERKLERYGAMAVAEVWFLHLHPPAITRYTWSAPSWRVDSPSRCEVLGGVSFVSVDDALEMLMPDGTPFPTSIADSELRANSEAARATTEAARAMAEAERATAAAARAAMELERAEDVAARARAAAGRADRLAARLRELGVDPDLV